MIADSKPNPFSASDQAHKVSAFIQGYERMAAWSDVLDRINVFPVADSDTGRNLAVSLAPLKQLQGSPQHTRMALMKCACGNSGNLAVAFLTGLLQFLEGADLAQAVRDGRDRAWQALPHPQPGTLLTVLDILMDCLTRPSTFEPMPFSELLFRLETAVRATPDFLPLLQKAKVVDAGALGMFIWLEGFFFTLDEARTPIAPLVPRFKGWLTPATSGLEMPAANDCVEVLVEGFKPQTNWAAHLPADTSSVVVLKNGARAKIHLHTPDQDAARQAIEAKGSIIQWTAQPIQVSDPKPSHPHQETKWHIMTDAAGSLTRQEAHRLGITLLDSYVIREGLVEPETTCDPQKIYAAMERGLRVSTAQASIFERHQQYQSILERHERVLYLCTGSVFTGNYDVARHWQQHHDTQQRLTVVDSTAASGRLAMIVHGAIRLLQAHPTPAAIEPRLQELISSSREFIFLDKLRYLAAGGRLSKTSAFCGDLLRMKPVISPTAEGAKKVAVLRRTEDQIAFALQQLHSGGTETRHRLILLEYSNNEKLLSEKVLPVVQNHFPQTDIRLQPLSLTTGVHTGPGSWGIAFWDNEYGVDG